jgi:hypothetical protein
MLFWVIKNKRQYILKFMPYITKRTCMLMLRMLLLNTQSIQGGVLEFTTIELF